MNDEDGAEDGLFDFDELEETELAKKADRDQRWRCSWIAANPKPGSEAAVQQEVAEQAAAEIATDALDSVQEPTLATKASKKPLSKSRAWFEIRRAFDAEPQQHYGSPNSDEWKAYYAKELILKNSLESFQKDGFCIIDAQLDPRAFKALVGKLALDAPEQRRALADHMAPPALPALGGGSAKWACGGSLAQQDVMPSLDDAGAGEVTGDSCGSDSHSRPESEQDRALCESCTVSLAAGKDSAMALVPRTKQQFFRFYKTFIHEVAVNSMDESKVLQEDKIHVQFCFGNMPVPPAVLPPPPPPAAICAGDVPYVD
eukprot:gnl/TRDRNA2_/TRDRNA2_198401_c0_seq1.p1 gnl/TRDRNA2_/TRDRNA2_198401_c0~~gnl/TRDRNA2_/TRDRNA2_198401_c0_seq1.p1  ORF type:complete len:350 (+),score=82.88 gnl/TRDRNA2_/TRDRNA2_198401_c0_seq1:108-1052(+)